MDRALRISWARAVAALHLWSSVRNAGLRSAPKPSGCATMWRPASTAIISRKGERSRLRSSGPKVRSRMSAQAGAGESSNYLARFFALVLTSLAQLVRPPSHTRRAEAARRLARHALLITAVAGVLVVALMVGVDGWEIGLMPPRGAASLWPARILTEFGRDADVLCILALMLLAVALAAAALRGTSRARLLAFGLRLQFLFFAVLAPLLAGEMIKW